MTTPVVKTADHHVITTGMILWDYDFQLVRVPADGLDRVHFDHGYEADPQKGWLDVRRLTDGGRKLMNGERLLVRGWDGKRADAEAMKRGLAIVSVGNKCVNEVHDADAPPAIGSFNLFGVWMDLCEGCWANLTNHEARVGFGHFYITGV